MHNIPTEDMIDHSSRSWSRFVSVMFSIANSQREQLPADLIAQLVEHRTSIAEVMGSNPIQVCFFVLLLLLFFFQALVSQLLNLCV